MHWPSAWHNVASETVVLAQLNGITDAERTVLLGEAVEACNRSLALRPPGIDPVGAGTTLGILAHALELSGEIEGAIDAHHQALTTAQELGLANVERQAVELLQ